MYAAEVLHHTGRFYFESMLVVSSTLNDVSSSVVIGCATYQTGLEALERGIGRRHHQTLGWTLSIAPNRPHSCHSLCVHHRWAISAHPHHSNRAQSPWLQLVIGPGLLLVKQISNSARKTHPVVCFLVANYPQAKPH